VQQFYHATEIVDVAIAVSVCAGQPSRQNKRQLFRKKWTIAKHNRKHA